MTQNGKNNSAAKSVIACYEIKDNAINKLGFKEIWEKYVSSKVDDVTCRNIFSFDMSVDALAESLKNSKDIDNELLDAIEAEFKSGANYMFINPEVGNPEDGYFIEPFLLKAKTYKMLS